MAEDATVYRTEVLFNAIYVIESLPTSDPKTGRDLYDDVIFPGTVRLDGLQTKFIAVQTVEQLATALADVARAVHLSGRLPIVHFEAHGDEEGIALADGTEVSWRTLVPMLGDINRASRMNLIVVAIACMGWNLTHALLPNDRAPLFMLVGPTTSMTASELLQATRQFYDALFSYLDVNRALEAMNDGLPYDGWRLKPATAEILFCRAFRTFIANGGSFEATPDQEDNLVASAVHRWSLDVHQAAMARAIIRRDFGEQRWWYNHLRRKFLMMDVHPKEEWRFGLDYDLCFGEARSRSS